ncbi:hypothetical protein [Streptomyces misionensis]
MSNLSVSLAQGIAQAARQAGQDNPVVRGADWQTAIVTAVNADGTVYIGSIRARCLERYANPAVGDQIAISRNGAGSWIALGRLATTTRAWTPFTLSSGWTSSGSYYTPSYRIWGDGTASLCGLATMSGTLTAGATVATLPAEACPASQVRCTVQVATGFFGVMTIAPSGAITLTDFSGTLSTTGSKWAEYDVFGRYRLV